jgi:hypothetical protein
LGNAKHAKQRTRAFVVVGCNPLDTRFAVDERDRVNAVFSVYDALSDSMPDLEPSSVRPAMQSHPEPNSSQFSGHWYEKGSLGTTLASSICMARTYSSAGVGAGG